MTEKDVKEMLRAKADTFGLRSLQPKHLRRQTRMRRARYALTVAPVVVAAVVGSAVATCAPRSQAAFAAFRLVKGASLRMPAGHPRRPTTRVAVIGRSRSRGSGSTPTACGRTA